MISYSMAGYQREMLGGKSFLDMYINKKSCIYTKKVLLDTFA